MSVDKRELILARLVVVAETIAGIKSVLRNRGDVPQEKRPAIQILDGDENADDGAFNKGRPAFSPNLIQMKPEIFLTLAEIDETLIGPTLNSFRLALTKAILTDTTLKALCSSGDMRYEGCQTDLRRSFDMNGEMLLRITFVYALIPSAM